MCIAFFQWTFSKIVRKCIHASNSNTETLNIDGTELIMYAYQNPHLNKIIFKHNY